MTFLNGGSRLMIGFAGVDLDDEFASVLRQTEARGVILFARNVVDADQVKELCSAIRALVEWPLVIAIDQEGGSVIRIENGVTVFPGNMALGQTGDEDLAYQVGHATGLEMASCGIDLILAPVVDLFVEEQNPIVGFRSFGSERSSTSKMARAFVRGIEAAGCSTCLKHFPGLGLATVDPHLGLPVIQGSLETLLDPHMLVFKDVYDELESRPAVMTTHVILDDVDPGTMATVSPRITRQVLREELGYRGCILTDDLEMGGALPLGEIEDAVVGAAMAGHDFLIICHRHDLQVRAAVALNAALAKGRLCVDEHQESIERIGRLHRRTTEHPKTFRLENHRQLAESVLRRVTGFLRDPQGIKDRLPGMSWTVHGDVEDETLRYFRGEFRSKRNGDVIGRLHLAADLASFPARQEDLKAATDAGMDDLVVVLLTSPRDLAFIPADVSVITAYGHRRSHLQAIVRFLRGKTD